MVHAKSVFLWAWAVFPFTSSFVASARENSPLYPSTTQQKPLARVDSHRTFQPGNFTKKQQNGTICKTNGETQWTGTVDVAHDRRLFYWFFDSRNDPEHDPIILWLNGGPGGSSMMGLFTELGPCLVTLDSSDTAAHPYSWNNNASVIFVDQPAGTGFSSVAPGSPYPDTDAKSAVDLSLFLNVFFSEIFPDRAQLPIHIAGESYGGHYVPELTNHILQSRAYDSRNSFVGNISSIVLVNALIENSAPAIGSWQLLCSDYRGHILNETACDKMAAAIPECEKLSYDCRQSNDKNRCFGANLYCMEEITTFYQSEVEAGRRSPYNIHLPCTNVPLCWDETRGNYSTYLSQPHILELLDFPANFKFQAVNLDLNIGFERTKSEFQSNVDKLTNILESGIKVLVVNGNEDFIVNTPGQMIMYESLPWSGQASYRASSWKTLGEDQGVWKTSQGGRLMFVGVDGAGHAAPGDQPEIIESVVRAWIHTGRIV